MNANNDLHAPLNPNALPPQTQPDNSFEEEMEPEEAPDNSIPLLGILSLRYYQQFFDTDTEEVLRKIKYALSVVLYKRFNELTRGRIDFYGPFWIYATLVFALAVSQNTYSYLTKPKDAAFEYTIAYVPNAFMIVYIFGIFMPIFFNLVIRAFGGYMEYFRIISIYGYSQCINVLMMVLCAYPKQSAQNFFIIWGAAHSSAFLFLCLHKELEKSAGNLKYIAVCTMAGCQVVLVIIYKRYFFGNLYPGVPIASVTPVMPIASIVPVAPINDEL